VKALFTMRPHPLVASLSAMVMIMTLTATTPAAAQASGCSIDYALQDEWGNGFVANVTITNNGPAINGWTVQWDYPSGQQVNPGWNGEFSQNGATVTVRNLSWNASIPTGGSTAFGFTGGYSGTNDPPMSFTLNGQTCGDVPGPGFEPRSLDGMGNNTQDPRLGAAGQNYRRVAAAVYGPGNAPVAPVAPLRHISNRIFNDTHQNLFSERGVTQWGANWGQFIDHVFGLRETDGENAPIPFDNADPLEEFTDVNGSLSFTRSGFVIDGQGVRQQPNTVNSFIDAFTVYGGTTDRLEWLRDGPVDGDLANNAATLLDVGGYLPTAGARPGVTAPTMEIAGRLQPDPTNAIIAGDRRANENIALTGAHTLFLREHNRIVEALPDNLDEQTRFEIARRVVGAEVQYITYNEFLPALGVRLPPYQGYDPDVDPTLSNEFATVGYRAHSMIHGEIEMEVAADRYTAAQLAAFEDEGIEVVVEAGAVELAVPLNLAFGSPHLVPALGLGPLLAGLAGEPQYKNDEQFDNQLRSVLFMEPNTDDPECLDGPTLPQCFTQAVADLGVIDVARAADHGIPSYNDLREAYGLTPKASFTDITGEDTDEFPDDPEIDAANPLDDPDILDFVELRDADGNVIPLDSEEAEAEAVVGIRRTTLAARLAAIYGDVDALDPFTGMISEEHLPGSDLGELQHAIWAEQFTALRDGDRFFFANDPALDNIEQQYGITYERTLRQVILDNTDLGAGDVPASMFFAE